MTDLITGATGFIGGRLLAALRRDGRAVRALVRRPAEIAGVDIVIGALGDPAALADACTGVDTVYHCAGFAHADRDPAADEKHRLVNLEAARDVAKAAASAGARRMVLLSSVKAMGPTGAEPVDEDWPAPPDTEYGRAKRAAEQAVAEIGAAHELETVSLRLAMVYGSGGRGNLERMARLVGRGLLPPPPETGNRRSLIHVDDVVASMRLAASHPQAAGGVFIVAHSQAHSGRALYDALRRALGLRPARASAPAAAFSAAARMGDALERTFALRSPINSQAIERLFGSACYAPTRIAERLGWRAEIDLDAGLAEMLGARPEHSGRVAA